MGKSEYFIIFEEIILQACLGISKFLVTNVKLKTVEIKNVFSQNYTFWVVVVVLF